MLNINKTKGFCQVVIDTQFNLGDFVISKTDPSKTVWMVNKFNIIPASIGVCIEYGCQQGMNSNWFLEQELKLAMDDEINQFMTGEEWQKQ